jgi:hypothetical protein
MIAAATSRLRRLGVPALVLGAGLLAGACGIPLSNAAQPLARSQVPPGLLVKPPPTTTTAPETPNARPIGVYFLNSSLTRLVKTTADEPTASPAEALGLLTYGLTAADNNLGYQTALVPQATPSVKVDNRTGVATVALDTSTEALFGSPLYDALAQIVYTITDPGFGVHSVVFTYLGTRVGAYLPNGTFPLRPVTRADYAQLAPATTTSTTVRAAPGRTAG